MRLSPHRILASLGGTLIALAALALPSAALPQDFGAPVADTDAESVLAQSGGILQGLRPPRLVPARPFSEAERTGRVADIEVGAGGGWFYLPPVLQWRFIPSDTPDSLIEVVLYSPYSGSATMTERFKLQIPSTSVPVSQRALVIAFHSFGVSEQQIFNTDLDDVCSSKGWFLLAPLGIVDVNFGNEPSQRALESILALVQGVFDFNQSKVYTFGFSMGGMGCMSFPIRHLDPNALRVAGVVHHTGIIDVVRDHTEATGGIQSIYENPLVFNGTPASNPFAYDRVNPMRFLPGGTLFSAQDAQLYSLQSVPFYLHVNKNDPTKYDEWNEDLKVDMDAQGFTSDFSFNFTAIAQHNINTIDFQQAMDWIDQYTLPPLPTTASIWADRAAAYYWSTLRTDPGGVLAKWTVDIDTATNSFSIADTEEVGTLAFDLGLMGLDGSQLLAFSAQSDDATPDTYVLEGYPAVPATVTVDGGAPFAWNYDAVAGELVITPNNDGSLASVTILP